MKINTKLTKQINYFIEQNIDLICGIIIHIFIQTL